MTNPKRVLMPIADGFEEIEAVTIVDVLRRAGVEVVVAGLLGDRVVGAHGMALETDTTLHRALDHSFDSIVLPGGMPGTTNLRDDPRVIELLQRQRKSGGHVAAICAAPMVLAAAGVVSGVPVTSHPSTQSQLGDAVLRSGDRVVRSGNIVTSQGPGTALEFALALVEDLVGADRAGELARAMVVRA